MHRDGNNAGPSLTRSLGDFDGGGLTYYPDDTNALPLEDLRAFGHLAETYDSHEAWVLFDGRRAHSVEPFAGERYSAVFFTIRQFECILPDQRAFLPTFPRKSMMQDLMKVLAPPRGYSKGAGVQMSILSAFGHRDKGRSLCMKPVSWAWLPKDVVALIVSFHKSVACVNRHFSFARHRDKRSK